MKIDILFALPGPANSTEPDKLLVVAAATEYEDPAQLDDILAEVADTVITAGTLCEDPQSDAGA
ncbi:MAG: hypothetical protein IPK78_15945 [Rhodospirillales bacterium]|nr:hypothetical protein [Rhodospirillales bacterium]